MTNDNEFDEIDDAALRALQEAVRALPHEVAPPAAAWENIRQRIEAGRVRELNTARTIAPQKSPRWRMPTTLIAAAIVIALVSVAMLKRIPSGDSSEAPSVASTATSTGAASVVYDRYDAAAADLNRDLDARRARLDPATVQVLDTCLSKINNAIAESRSGLAAAPGDEVIAGLLTAAYEQKLDLLRRAEELPLRSF